MTHLLFELHPVLEPIQLRALLAFSALTKYDSATKSLLNRWQLQEGYSHAPYNIAVLAGTENVGNFIENVN
jgi:hypothetical protein